MSATPADPWTPIAVPKQASAKEGTANIGAAKLWYWDTGGNGEVVVLNHPAAQGADCWKYQQPVLAKAGYRVIGWSRRGTHRSERGPEGDTGTAASDLARLLDVLKIDRAHLVGSAEGGAVVTHFALENPKRVRALILAGARLGVAEEDYRGMDKRVWLPPTTTRPSPSPISAPAIAAPMRPASRPGPRWPARRTRLHPPSPSPARRRPTADMGAAADARHAHHAADRRCRPLFERRA
jgi:pimeloyl-ACP methyl ester carboxylesterase